MINVIDFSVFVIATLGTCVGEQIAGILVSRMTQPCPTSEHPATCSLCRFVLFRVGFDAEMNRQVSTGFRFASQACVGDRS